MNQKATLTPSVQWHFEGIALMAKEAAESNDRRLRLDALASLQLATKELQRTLKQTEGRP